MDAQDGDSDALEAPREPVVPGRKRRKIKLDSAAAVRRELARLYRAMDAGTVPSVEGMRRARVLAELRQTIELAELERRVREVLKGRIEPT